MSSEQHLRELEEKYEDYKVYDRNGEKIGKVDDLFIDETDHEEYIGVKMGIFGLKSTLIPMEVVRVNEADRRIEVSETKDFVKDAPTFSDDDEIDASFEESIRRHFNLESGGSPGGRGSYGPYASAASSAATDRSESRPEDRPEGRYEGRSEGITEGTPEYRSEERPVGEPGSGEFRDTEETHREGSASSRPASSGSGRETYATETDREASRGDEEHFGAPVGDPGSKEFRGMEERQRADVSREGTSSEGETREMPAGGDTASEAGSDEGEGRARVRRRVIREEIIEEEPRDSER